MLQLRKARSSEITAMHILPLRPPFTSSLINRLLFFHSLLSPLLYWKFAKFQLLNTYQRRRSTVTHHLSFSKSPPINFVRLLVYQVKIAIGIG